MAAAVSPEKLIEELHELWVSLGSEAHAENKSGVLRACAMTLIVAAEESDDPAAIGETLAELMREHPSRAIVVRTRPADEPYLEARVFAQCWLPLGQRRQICSEQIEIITSHASLPDVPALLVALIAPDLPVVVWCRCSELYRSPALQQLSDLADKLIVDSNGFRDTPAVLSRLADDLRAGRHVADLAWARLTRWREMMAQVFEAPDCRKGCEDFTELGISYAGDSIPVSAYYMAAWLSAGLGWSPDDARLLFARAQESDKGLEGVTLSSEAMKISLERRSEQALELRVNGLSHRSVLPSPADSAVLGEELSIAGRDPVFEGALEAAEQIAAVSRSQ